MGQSTTGKMNSVVIILLAGLVAYTSAASVNRNDHRMEPMESLKDHQNEASQSAKALVRAVNDHRLDAMESPADHDNDVHQSAKALGQWYGDRMEAMESAGDHTNDVVAHQASKALVRDVHVGKEPMETMENAQSKALVRDVIDHRREPMETMGTVNKQSGSG